MITRWWISPGGQIRLRAQSSRNNSGENRTVLMIDVGERLDLASNDLMHRACEFSWRYQADRIIVNLALTNRLHDSGLAMLLLLKNKSATSVLNIDIANSNTDIRSILGKVVLPLPIALL